MKNNYQVVNLKADNFEIYIDQMAEIEKNSFAEAWTKEAYIKDITSNSNAHYIAITDNNTLIAYANYWLIADEGDINNVAVNPKYRGQGFGKLLRGL